MIARDPSLEEAIRSAIAKGEPAAWAVDRAFDAFGAMLFDLGGYMAERTSDLDDVRNRTIARLLGQPMPGLPERDDPYVLVADDLAPADTVMLDPTQRPRPGHAARRPDEPHRDPRPEPRAAGRRVVRRGERRSATATWSRWTAPPARSGRGSPRAKPQS